MKKAAIYARVSTDKQEKQRTIESQLAELRSSCATDCAQVVREYIDDGFSGATLIRPGLDGLRDDASRGMFQSIYILSPDRLSRKYVYQVIVIEELRKRGIEVVFLNKPVTDRPEDQLLLGVQGLIAEYERAQIIERTRRGKLHRARLGEMMGGSGPYGYDYAPKSGNVPADWKVNEKEAEVVKLVFELCLQQTSFHQIARDLTLRGIRTKRGARYWRPTVVQRLLTNECYVGRAFYNKYRKGREVYQKRERAEWVAMEVPRIIDDETFQLAQETLSRRGRGGHGNRPGRIFLLSGLLRCLYCNSPYNGCSANASKDSYYRCSNFAIKFPQSRTCWARAVRADRIEDMVIERVKDAVLRPEVLQKSVLEMGRQVQLKAKTWEESRSKLLNRQELLGEKKRRLLDLHLDGIISRAEYQDRGRELEEEWQTLQLKLQKWNEVPVELDEGMVAQKVKEFTEFARQKLEAVSAVELKQFLRSLFDEATFDWKDGVVRLNGHIPAADKLYRSTPDKAGVVWRVTAPLSFELEARL